MDKKKHIDTKYKRILYWTLPKGLEVQHDKYPDTREQLKRD